MAVIVDRRGAETWVWNTSTLDWERATQVTSSGASPTDVNVLNFPATQAVSATNLDVRDLAFATDKVDASGTVLGAGTNNIGDVDVLSSALPTGASTSAKQDTEIASLASIDTKVTGLATSTLQTSGGQKTQISNAAGTQSASVAATGAAYATGAPGVMVAGWYNSGVQLSLPIVPANWILPAGNEAAVVVTNRDAVETDGGTKRRDTFSPGGGVSNMTAISVKHQFSQDWLSTDAPTNSNYGLVTREYGQGYLVSGNISAVAQRATVNSRRVVKTVALFKLTSNLFVGTMRPVVSLDGGTTYSYVLAINCTTGAAGSTFNDSEVTGTWVVPFGAGATNYGFEITARTSGTVTFEISGNSVGSNGIFTLATLQQAGSQVGTTNPLYTQDYDPEYSLGWGTTNLRDRLVAQRYTVLSDSIADGLASFWTSTVANGGTNTVVTGEGLLQTSANALGSAQLSSWNVPYHPGQSAWLNSAIRFGDTGSVGNIRRVGCFTVSGTTPQDGFYYELSGTTLNAVSVKGGVATAVASTSWTKFSTAPFTLTTNYHQLEIRFTSNGAQFYVDNVLRHTASGGATSITSTLNFPITLQNINSSGATNRVLACRNIGMGRFGLPPFTAEAKDSGRNQTNHFMAAGIAGTNAEVMQSLTGYKSGAAVGATATPAVVTTGKTYRITSITLTYQSLAGAGGCQFRLRANTAGAGVVTSPLVATYQIGSAAAVAGVTSTVEIPIPDGMEFASGTGIAVGMLGINTVGAAAASGFGTITINGYEY